MKKVISLLFIAFSYLSLYSQSAANVGNFVINNLPNFDVISIVHQSDELFIANFESDLEQMPIYIAKDIVMTSIVDPYCEMTILEPWEFYFDSNSTHIILRYFCEGSEFDIGMSLSENSCKNVEIGMLIIKVK